MRNARVFIPIILASFTLLPGGAAAQQTGEIRGTVVDATGAALPGVSVAARSPSLQGVRTDTQTGKDTGLPSFRGQGDAANNWLVDGLSTKGVNDNSPGVRINHDSWAEVQVISDGFEPMLGQAVGGFVSIVTRSGGNAFKGEAGTLLRLGRLRAERQEQLSAASLPETSIQHYYGNFGGPILKDRFWFFVSDNCFGNTDTTTEQAIGWLTIPPGERQRSSNNVFGRAPMRRRPITPSRLPSPWTP